MYKIVFHDIPKVGDTFNCEISGNIVKQHRKFYMDFKWPFFHWYWIIDKMEFREVSMVPK